MGITTIERERNIGEAVDESHEGPWEENLWTPEASMH
jgi:hypothetical protein